MKMYRLQRQQWVSQPLDSIYEFFENPENLASITPHSLGFKVLTPPPISMEQGRIIDYTIRFSGLTLRWRSIISSYQPPFMFVDEQLLGPFSFWHHRHEFKRQKGGTLICDDLRYALPLYLPGILSFSIHHLLVRPRLENIFNFRRQQFDRLFNQGGNDRRIATPCMALNNG